MKIKGISNRIKNTIQYKALMVCFGVLIILSLIGIFSYNYDEGGRELEGELGEMGVFGEISSPENCSVRELKKVWDDVFKESLGGVRIVNSSDCSSYSLYKLYNENKSIKYVFGARINNSRILFSMYINSNELFNITGNSTEKMQSLFIMVFEAGSNAKEYPNDLSSEEAEDYFRSIYSIDIRSLEESSEVYSFNNVTYNPYNKTHGTLIESAAGIGKTTNYTSYYFSNSSIYTIQKREIEDIKINKSKNVTLNLSEYIDSSIKLGWFSVSINDDEGRVVLNEDYDSQNQDYLFVNLIGSKGGISNVSLYLEDNRYPINFSTNYFIVNVTEPQGSQNSPPEFLDEECDGLDWFKNNNYTINLEDCFEDEDNDSLNFSYDNDEDNISIERLGDELTIIPDTNWIGRGDFNIYAEDEENETKGDVDFEVYNISRGSDNQSSSENDSDDGDEEDGEDEDNISIENPSPSGSDVEVSVGENQKFSIDNEDYDSIKWYLDGEEVKKDSGVYYFKGEKEEKYNVEVEVQKGEDIRSKKWVVSVKKSKGELEHPDYIGNIVFYGIIITIIIIIGLIIWLLIISRKGEVRKGVGVFGGRVRSDNESLNIPGNG